jgi:hypothetical protein
MVPKTTSGVLRITALLVVKDWDDECVKMACAPNILAQSQQTMPNGPESSAHIVGNDKNLPTCVPGERKGIVA